MAERQVVLDGNEAAAHVAYRTSEVIAIYPITPSTPMGEWADAWAEKGIRNLWGAVPRIQEMQSEGGAAGAVHGALQAGSLSTTFTASQGLLLMIPNMYKIAGELTSTVFHVAARSLATQGLSIFGDHGDVMAVRATGWGILFSHSVQEAMDFALIAQAASLRSRIPFVHAFDGFRTSHELNKITPLSDREIAALIDPDLVRAHRERGLSPDRPFIRGTAQNPDVYFQARETVNPYYQAAPGIVRSGMEKFAALTGRRYRLFDYAGAPHAERVVVLMGSGSETAEETALSLAAQGEKVGVVKVRLFRPFSADDFLSALPPTTRAIAVLDRTKEPGSAGEPLYQDVLTALGAAFSRGGLRLRAFPRVIGGRYGLGSKEFTPAMAKAVFEELEKPEPRSGFTVGIRDDMAGTSLDYDPSFSLERPDTVRATFWGLGSDGTVGANKNSAKIIGEAEDGEAQCVQGYFVYDSKKSGSLTVSHLRFGPRPIRMPYLIERATFTAVHHFRFLEKFPVLEALEPGGTLLLNSPYGPDELWNRLPAEAQRQCLDKKLKVYAVDAYALASSLGLDRRINTVMQACFFLVSGVLPADKALEKIKGAIAKSYAGKGTKVVDQNMRAVDLARERMFRLEIPAGRAEPGAESAPSAPSGEPPEFFRRVTSVMLAGKGDSLPVSALPVDGTYPSATSQWEKRGIALEVPVWEKELCIQCGKCVLVCPHAAIRGKVFAAETPLPAGFGSVPAKWAALKEMSYTLQVSSEDCTGCTLCVDICPVTDKADPARKALNMVAKADLPEGSQAHWERFLELPDLAPAGSPLKFTQVKDIQLLRPLFEFSGACSGCGETPYLKLLSQLFGDRMVVANATGCSSIYGGNLPTTPWAKNAEGRGPAWSNSLFEDNAEFGLGLHLGLEHRAAHARRLLAAHRDLLGGELVDALLSGPQETAEDIERQRERVRLVKELLRGAEGADLKDLEALADSLVEKTVWIVGGDGWAYDIGFGGLDHVLASGQRVRLLVLDTEVYSNTGGQASKSTPLAAMAKFAAGGKLSGKKDLGLMAMSYGNVYVASVAMGANDQQTVKAILEAEAHPGPSLVIAYSHCIAHGFEIEDGLKHQKSAVDSGQWLLYRYNPALREQGRSPLQLDSRDPKISLEDYFKSEGRFKTLWAGKNGTAPGEKDSAAEFLAQAKEAAERRRDLYRKLAEAGTPAPAAPNPEQVRDPAQ